MRFLSGLIIGIALTVMAAYVNDTMSTPAPNSETQTINERRPLVNWDVAAQKWEALKTRTRDDWNRLSSG